MIVVCIVSILVTDVLLSQWLRKRETIENKKEAEKINIYCNCYFSNSNYNDSDNK